MSYTLPITTYWHGIVVYFYKKMFPRYFVFNISKNKKFVTKMASWDHFDLASANIFISFFCYNAIEIGVQSQHKSHFRQCL